MRKLELVLTIFPRQQPHCWLEDQLEGCHVLFADGVLGVRRLDLALVEITICQGRQRGRKEILGTISPGI